jgi:hypothetical protein
VAGVAFRLGHGVTQGAAAVDEYTTEKPVARVQPPTITILSDLNHGRGSMHRDSHQ